MKEIKDLVIEYPVPSHFSKESFEFYLSISASIVEKIQSLPKPTERNILIVFFNVEIPTGDLSSPTATISMLDKKDLLMETLFESVEKKEENNFVFSQISKNHENLLYAVLDLEKQNKVAEKKEIEKKQLLYDNAFKSAYIEYNKTIKNIVITIPMPSMRSSDFDYEFFRAFFSNIFEIIQISQSFQKKLVSFRGKMTSSKNKNKVQKTIGNINALLDRLLIKSYDGEICPLQNESLEELIEYCILISELPPLTSDKDDQTNFSNLSFQILDMFDECQRFIGKIYRKKPVKSLSMYIRDLRKKMKKSTKKAIAV
ncbi:TPA: hypothetical protein DEP21_06610 [Patescibacteria group bacterium]|nr:hypothetical protein [Candidatus Gracilibacteria bacterium]